MAGSQNFTIAVVDNDQRVLESLEELLESAGHTVFLFSSAHELLTSARLATLDCLISDIGMPNVDGFELQRLLRTRRPNLPVIFITGRYEMTDPQIVLAKLPGSTFFHKPFDDQELLDALAAAVDSARKLR